MNHQGPRFYNDDGTEFNPDLIPVPDLCISCAKNNAHDAKEEILCGLTRADGQNEEVFLCFAYQPNSPNIDREDVLRDLCKRAGVEYEEESAGGDGEDTETIYF